MDHGWVEHRGMVIENVPTGACNPEFVLYHEPCNFDDSLDPLFDIFDEVTREFRYRIWDKQDYYETYNPECMRRYGIKKLHEMIQAQPNDDWSWVDPRHLAKMDEICNQWKEAA